MTQISAVRAELDKVEKLPYSESNVRMEQEVSIRLNDLLYNEEMLWRQKSRVNWVGKSDRCTKYFFISTLARRRRNHLNYVKGDDRNWLHSREAIGNALISGLLASQGSDYPANLDNLLLPRVNEREWDNLLSAPS